jgi:hypothetical protein
MTLPHPKSRQDKDGNGNKPNHGSVVRKLDKRTIDIADYRNAKDNVNPAKNRAFRCVSHNCLSSEQRMRRFRGTTSKSIYR